MTKPLAPTHEIGYAQPPSYQWWAYQNETTPELMWPQSISVYDTMRRTDSQVTSVLRAMTLPVRRTTWRIDPNGARDEVVRFVADDLGLPIVGKNPTPPPRTKDRFSWADHLRLALLMLPFGHMIFEQTYRVDADGNRAHLRKLGPRMPGTIEYFDVAPDGGLISITQYWTSLDAEQKPIPVDRLVAYVHEKEGGNWIGQSILRPAYKNWLLKDRLLRVQARTIERNGMGIPLYKDAEGADPAAHAAGLAMAKAWRSGEEAGSAIPFGADLSLVGVSGTLPDAEPVVRYHDEQIGRAVLAHFLNLGTQTGSWALGTTFADFFTMSLQTLAEQVADVATQHIVEDLVDVNWGTEEPAPKIVFDEIGSRQAATAASIRSLVDAGIIEPDAVLEESTRQQYGLPPKDPDTTRGQDQQQGTDMGGGAQPFYASAGGADPKVPSGTDDIDGYDDDEPGQFDELTAVLAAALSEFMGEVRAAGLSDWNPDLHPRDKSGRFRTVFARVMHALELWSKGQGGDHPLKGQGFTTANLRTVATKHFGLKVRRSTEKNPVTPEELEGLLLDHVRTHVRGVRDRKAEEGPKRAKFTLQSGTRKGQDVAVYRDPAGKPALYRENDAGTKGRLVRKFDSLDDMAAWADGNGEPHVAEWARKEAGGKAPAKAPAAATTAPTARKLPVYEPPASLSVADQSRAARLVRADPQIFATVHERFGRIAASGNLSEGDADWLQSVYEREPAYVNRLAQSMQIERYQREDAKKAGKTLSEYRRDTADQLKGLLADKPIAIRTRDEASVRAILSGGRFKTQHEGVRRAAGLDANPDHRRLGEEILGIPADTPHEDRPVYGYVAVNGIEPALSAGKKIPGIAQREGQEDILSSYGTVQVVLKPGVRGRTTATVGDSLDEIGFVRPSPVDSPSADSVMHSLDAPHGPLTDPKWTRRRYVEAQIHGGVRSDDIAEVVFADQPESATVAALDKAGVPYRVLRPGDAPIRPTPAAKADSPALSMYSPTEAAKISPGLDMTVPESRDVINAEARRRVETVLDDVDQMLTGDASDRALRNRLEGRRKAGAPASVVDELEAAVRQDEVENRIRAAYRSAVADGGRRSGLVDLADVRDRLPDLDRSEVDAALTRMAKTSPVDGPRVILSPNESPRHRTARDNAAALRIPTYGAGDANHYLTIEDPSPRRDRVRQVSADIRGRLGPPKPDVRPETDPDRIAFIADRPRADAAAEAARKLATEERAAAAKGMTLDEWRASRTPAKKAPGRAARKPNTSAHEAILSYDPGGPAGPAERRLRELAQKEGIQLGGRKAAPGRAAAKVAGPKATDLPDASDPEVLRDALDLRTVVELKAMLKARGLPVSGRKRELVDRLVDGGGAGPKVDAPSRRVARATKAATIGDVILGPTQFEVAMGLADTPSIFFHDYGDHRLTGTDGLVMHRGVRLPEDFASSKDDIYKGHFAERPGLTAEENRALDLYVLSRVADPLNRSLRSGATTHGTIDTGVRRLGTVDLDEIATQLDSAIAAGELVDDTNLYRGSMMRPADVGRLQPGAITAESGFLSTTTDRGNAHQIMGWRRGKTDTRGRSPVLFQIRVPAGTHAAVAHVEENEVLLGRGRQMRVIDVTRPTRPGDVRVVTLELMPSPTFE